MKDCLSMIVTIILFILSSSLFHHRLKRGGEGLETADIGAFLFFVVLSYPHKFSMQYHHLDQVSQFTYVTQKWNCMVQNAEVTVLTKHTHNKSCLILTAHNII